MVPVNKVFFHTINCSPPHFVQEIIIIFIFLYFVRNKKCSFILMVIFFCVNFFSDRSLEGVDSSSFLTNEGKGVWFFMSLTQKVRKFSESLILSTMGFFEEQSRLSRPDRLIPLSHLTGTTTSTTVITSITTSTTIGTTTVINTGTTTCTTGIVFDFSMSLLR